MCTVISMLSVVREVCTVISTLRVGRLEVCELFIRWPSDVSILDVVDVQELLQGFVGDRGADVSEVHADVTLRNGWGLVR